MKNIFFALVDIDEPRAIMVSTRRSQKSATSGDGSTPTGTKRKEHATSPQSNHETKAAKTQTTIEDTIGGAGVRHHNDTVEAVENNQCKRTIPIDTEMEESKVPSESFEESRESEIVASEGIEYSSQREEEIPSSILEKGIVYFFTRNRVGIEDTKSVGDLQRTFFVLRPLPAGAKLIDGAIPDLGNNRLLALPKKCFPRNHQERFMAFVEKSKTTIQDLKDNFFKGSEYNTKTLGTRHVDPVTPIGEGVYVISQSKDESTHFVYTMTIPLELGEVQEELGLRPRGSFAVSVKNPERPGPQSTRLPQGPEFPKEIIEEFRGLAWAKLKPEYLDYPNCQILLIGEDVDSAKKTDTKGKTQDTATPREEVEKLEHEDELRVEHLDGNDTVFLDLDISKSEYSEVPTTW